MDIVKLRSVVDEWLSGTDYFLVDLTVSPAAEVAVVIDHQDGVWIEDCAELSRFIEQHFDREEEDYELEVGSAGLGQPFKVHRQWEIHVGSPVETQLKDGTRLRGILAEVGAEAFTMEVEEKVKPEGAKRARKEIVSRSVAFADVAYTKYLIKLK